MFLVREQYKRVIDDDDDVEDSANADDDDIATTIVRVSLQCPLAKFRMMFPAKGKNCSHLQCFDGSAYISLNEKKPMWICPVCSRPLYYDDLQIDQYVRFSKVELKDYAFPPSAFGGITCALTITWNIIQIYSIIVQLIAIEMFYLCVRVEQLSSNQ